MPQDLFLPTSMSLGFIAWGLIARWYVMPHWRGITRAAALIPQLLLHCFRFIGLAFLIPGVTNVPLDPRFAEPAAYGDLLAAVLALVAILALRQRWAVATALVWIFNVEGTLDLINAVARGLRYTQDGQLGAAYFIPAVIVPALLVSHVLIFILLLKREGGSEFPEGSRER